MYDDQRRRERDKEVVKEKRGRDEEHVKKCVVRWRKGFTKSWDTTLCCVASLGQYFSPHTKYLIKSTKFSELLGEWFYIHSNRIGEEIRVSCLIYCKIIIFGGVNYGWYM